MIRKNVLFLLKSVPFGTQYLFQKTIDVEHHIQRLIDALREEPFWAGGHDHHDQDPGH